MKKSRRQRKNQKPLPPFNLENEPIYRQKFQQFMEAGSFGKAEAALEQIGKCNPKADLAEEAKQLYSERGNHYLEHHQYVNALQDFLLVQKEYGQTEDSVYGLCKCHVLLNHPEKAERFLRDLEQSSELSALQQGLLLKTLFIQEKIKAAQNYFKKHKANLTPTDVKWAEGVTALLENNAARAYESFQKMEDNAEGASNSDAWKAYALLENKQYDEAHVHQEKIDSPNLKARLYSHEYHISGSLKAKKIAEQLMPQIHRRSRRDDDFFDFLMDAFRHGDFLEVFNTIEEEPGLFQKIENHQQLKKAIYRSGALDAYRQGEAKIAESVWNKTIPLFEGDWDFYKNLLLFTWDGDFKSYPNWIKHGDNALTQMAEDKSAGWTDQSLKVARAELAGLLGLHYRKTQKKLREKVERKKAETDAPEGTSVLIFKAFEAFEKKDWETTLEIFQEVEKKGGMVTASMYGAMKTCFNKGEKIEELSQFRGKYGVDFSDTPIPLNELIDSLFFALGKEDLHFLEYLLTQMEGESHFLIDAAKNILQAAPKHEWDSRFKIECNLELSVIQNHIETIRNEKNKSQLLCFYWIALNFFKKTGAHRKTIKYLKETIEDQARKSEFAKIMQVQGLGGFKKVGKDYYQVYDELMKATGGSSKVMVELQRFWYVMGIQKKNLDEWKAVFEREPENPCVLWALSVLDKRHFHVYERKGLQIARRLQHKQAFDLFGLENGLQAMEELYHKFQYRDEYYGDDWDDEDDDFFEEMFGSGPGPFDLLPKGSDGQPDPGDIANLLGALTGSGDIGSLLEELREDPSLIEEAQFGMQLMTQLISLSPKELNQVFKEYQVPRSLQQELRDIIKTINSDINKMKMPF